MSMPANYHHFPPPKTFHLPLVLEAKEEITVDGLKEVAKDLKNDIHLLQKHICNWKDLSYVKVKNVTFESRSVYLTIEIDKNLLDSFYAIIKDEKNELSKCLEAYFNEQSIEFIAGLPRGQPLSCKVQKTRRDHLNAQYEKGQEEKDFQGHLKTDDTKRGKRINVHYETVSEKGVEPGSYPHGEKRKEHNASSSRKGHTVSDSIKDSFKSHRSIIEKESEDDLIPVARKQFILYRSPILPKGWSKGWKIVDVYIDSDNCKILNKRLTSHHENLYQTTIEIPLNHLERRSGFSFCYVVEWERVGLLGYISKHKETSKKFFVEDSNCYRHLWSKSDQKLSQEDTVFGYTEHLEDIMFNSPSNVDSKSACIEIEMFCSKFNSREDNFSILKNLIAKLSATGFKPVHSLLFLVVVKSLLMSYESISKNKLVNTENAKSLIQAVKSTRLKSLPTSSQREMQSVYYQFCLIVLASNMCCLTYLCLMYPFFDEEDVLRKVESYVSAKATICKNSEDMLPFANELCTKLYQKAISDTSPSTNRAKSILEKLLRHLPIKVAMHVFTCLYREECLSSIESDIQSVLYGSISVRVSKMLADAKKSNNLSTLISDWKAIERFDCLSSKFRNKFEYAVIQILDSNYGLIGSIEEIMDDFIYKHEFFKEQSKQKELVDVIVKSKNAEVNSLFVSLANSTKMCEFYMQLETTQFKQYCVTFIWGKSQGMSHEYTFSYVCENFNKIWHMQQIERRRDFQSVLEDLLFEVFQTYRFRDLLQKLKMLDKISSDNQHFGMIFLKYIRSNLAFNYDGFHPEDIFRWIDGTSDSPRVDTRLSAQVLNVLIDTHGYLQPEQSVFEHFQQLLDHGKFWRTLFVCGGYFIDIIKKNDNFLHVRTCIKQTVDLFKSHQVSYDFVVDIENNTQLCRTTKSLLELECERKEIEKCWSEALMRFKEEKDKLRKSQKVIETICSKLKSEELHECFINISKHLKKVEGKLTGGKMTAKECIENNLLWKGMEELPALCEYLESIVPSNVFWNICSEDVTEEYRKNVHHQADIDDPLLSICLLFQEISIQDKDTINSSNAIQYLQILAKSGIQAYKDGWTRLLSEETFMMNGVLLMFGKRPNIKFEVEIARRVFYFDVSEDVSTTLERVYSVEKVKTAVHAVTSVLRAFKLDHDSSFEMSIESFNKLKKGAAAEYTFSDVRTALDVIYSSIKDLSDNTINIMNVLGKSTSLIGFLQEIVDEDIRNLIDAVEDISEQQVRESTVSALIEVKRYIQPILLPSSKRTSQELVQILETQTRCCRGNPLSLPAKIADCMAHLHNLKSLYNNVANRGEQTKEMIKNINQRGTFVFRLNKEVDLIDFEVNYKQNKTKEVRQRSTLTDLRSRALLLMNTERKDVAGSHVQSEDLANFVNYINLCLDIAECLFELYSTGNIEDKQLRTLVKPTDLENKKMTLNLILKNWLLDIQTERDQHYLMNFVQGTQIQILYRFLEGDDKDVLVIHTLLKFIHPRMQVERLREFYQAEKAHLAEINDRAMLHCIGATLTKEYNGLAVYERPITNDMYSRKITDRVQTSKLLVAQLEGGSINTVKTVISLYLNTTQRLPEPYQVLFCTRSTTKNELDLLIRRCLRAESFHKVKSLFCIANVELLPNEIQFSLVDTLRHIGRDQKYLLALVCRGSRSHPFIDELNEFVTSVAPATDKTVRQIFQEHCAYVSTISSDNAGQGKTTLIYKNSQKNEKSVTTLHISGPIRKSVLIDKLQSMNIKEFHLLHIDIGSVDDATELDTFIFELVVLRYVSTVKVSFILRTHDIEIEIANTIHDTLRNALQTAMLFSRKHVEWKGVNSFVVSKEKESPIQVVCKYLDCLERNILDKVDLMAMNEDHKPLSKGNCRRLLRKYLDGALFTSYPIIHTFLNVLADQLKKLSQSSFFRISRLRDMVGSKTPLTIKSKLVHAMIQMSREFATRSVIECRAVQSSTIKTGFDGEDGETAQASIASESVNRVNGMIRWEESNHQVFVFHNQNIQTLSALYRRLDKVEEDVKVLFESQMKKKMDDFSKMNQEALQNILQKVSRGNPLPLPDKKLVSLANNYALTADNLLKMVLIMLRIKANVPVIIMGETGCGKTSLIRYLAQICEVEFDVMNIHAGVSADEILSKVQHANEQALNDINGERWLFLDEINTSESIGMMSDMLCHHTYLGKELSPNLIVLGACNPYKLRTSKAISTAGLDSKVVTDELSRLVYRVLPLPDMLVDFVWDFGSLSEEDENKYIFRMTDDVFPLDSNLHDALTSLLSASQAFVREKESSAYSVSLRDVQRCKQLTKWFHEILNKKGPYKGTVRYECNVSIKAIILALAHCYHSRFADKLLRKHYREMISKVFVMHGYVFCEGQEDFINGVIREEQKDILGRMELPPGTACNTALQENVFVILVCIFNRIPIFVVGKPGCSKSLAMQLIRSNLRGKDSNDEFFKTLPQLYCVSFQGSESSTSDGIFKVFEKAENYQISNSREDVLSVVILDEIGLAEISRFNPLKVLHNLLEPDGQSQPNVAVVGISNWALDASKMNRAIHLSRTEMDIEELFDTAVSISESFLDSEAAKSETLFEDDKMEKTVSTSDITDELHSMAEAYFNYIKQMRFKNFHGLRDYYSLVKYVARMFAENGRDLSEAEKANLVIWGLERNFGGLPAEKQTLHDVFRRYLPISSLSQHKTIDLVTQNIQDSIARHLMLITTGESVLGIIQQKIQDMGCERIEVIFGSQFEEDLTDDYNYRILSRIILCMEEGVVLILKDLESIYGSLYDMLNQNYTVIGKKRNCRVALGPYSNPICHVADSFRCIVLMDESKLDMSDPPFLNRFEKQHLRFFDILDESQRVLITEIETWIDDLVIDGSTKVSKNDIFPIYSEDMVASLVLKYDDGFASKTDTPYDCIDYEAVFHECKKKLLWVMKPEIVVRIKSASNPSAKLSSDDFVSDYFSLPIHGGLTELISYQIKNDAPGAGHLSVVFTNSNVHTKVPNSLEEIIIQVEKVGAFKSEKQLSSKIQMFWKREDCHILVVQCNAKEDERHLMLTKLVIERYRREYQREVHLHQKHVYLVVHLDRSTVSSNCVTQLNFLSEWNLIMIDSIECPEIKLPELCSMTLLEAIQQKQPLHDYLKDELFWAFTRIKYEDNSRDVYSLTNVITNMENTSTFLDMLDKEMWTWILKNKSRKQDKNWQFSVACDTTLLNTSSSFVHALETFVLGIIKTPLSKYIYNIELHGILDSFLSTEKRYTLTGLEIDNIDERQEVWINLLHDNSVFSLEDIPDETGPECYTCPTLDLSLQMPFSLSIFEKIEETKHDFLETVRLYKTQCLLEEDEELPQEVYEEVLCQQENFILQKLPDLNKYLYKMWGEDYFDDFCSICSHKVCPRMNKKQRTQYAKLIFAKHIEMKYKDPFVFVIRLHTLFWVQFPIFTAEMMLIEASLKVVPGIESEIEKALLKFIKLDTVLSNESRDLPTDIKQNKFSIETHEVLTSFEESTQNSLLDDEIKDENIVLEDITIVSNPIDTLMNVNNNEQSNDTDECSLLEKAKNTIQVMPENIGNAEEFPTDESIIADLETVDIHSDYIEHSIQSEQLIQAADDDIESPEMDSGASLLANDFLVQLLCRRMIPTTDNISFHRGVRNWYSKVSRTLSLAHQVTQTPKLLYSLKVCTELSAELLLPFNLNDNLLEDMGNNLACEFDLDSKEIFENIRAIFNAALKLEPVSGSSVSRKCIKVLSSYLIMCITCEPDTTALNFMFSLIIDGSIREELLYLLKAPLLLSLSLVEREMLIKLISTNSRHSNDDSDMESQCSDVSINTDDCVLLDNLDEIIISISETKGINHPFIVMLVDMFQKMFTGFMREDENDESETSLIEGSDMIPFPLPRQSEDIFLACHMLLRRRIVGIRYIVAIGYYKAYIDFAVLHLNLTEDDGFNLGQLDVVLSDDTVITLCQYTNILFIKMMLKNNTISQVETFCKKHSNELKFVQQIKWTDGYSARCYEKDPLCLFTGKDINKTTELCRQTKDICAYKEEIQKIIRNAKSCVEGMVCLFSIAINDFYLCRLTSSLDDTKRTKATVLLNEAIGHGIDRTALGFLKCIIGEENFNFHAFDLNEESSEELFYKVSFCSSLYAIVTAHFCFVDGNSASTLMKCICVPGELKDCIIPGFLSYTKRDTSTKANKCMLVRTALCPCGHHIAFYDHREVLTCPICNGKLESGKVNDENEDLVGDVQCSFSVSAEVDMLEFYHMLHPITLHIIQFITKACLLGSKALNPGDPQTIEAITNVPEIKVCDMLWDAIGVHWDTLRELLNVDNNMLFFILHAILKESTEMICKSKSYVTIDDALSWEKQFNHIVETIVKDRFTNVKRNIRKHDCLNEFGDEVFEQRFFEVENEDNWLSGEVALFRFVAAPCKENFVSELYHHIDDFPLLTLVLRYEQKLSLPEHILNIMNWHMATIANANYVLKKSECLKMSVQDFIYNRREKNNERSNLVWERFELFRLSWEYLIHNLGDIRSDLKMKHIHSESKMSDCLLLGKKSVVFEVLQELVDIQNNLISQVLSFSNSNVSLQFLLRETNVAVIPSVQIIDIKKDDLLKCNINWQGLLEQESQCDLRYGHGRYIHYDFESIEQSIAVEIFLGKTFIQMTKHFPKIIFKDELHKNYSSLVRELKSNIPQEVLPSEIANGIKLRKDEDPRMATKLLTHIGVVMSLMNKTKGDPDRPLVEYVDGWKSLLAHSFPKNLLPGPDSSIKLCHVIGLSELLEELCADSVKNGLSDEFRCKLDGPIKDQIMKSLKDERLAVAFLKAMKRFTYRCLSSRTASASQSLREYLSDDTFWPDGYFVNGYLVINEKHIKLTEILPDGLMVRHTYECLITVEKHIEKRRQEDIKLTAFATSFRTNTRASPNVKAAEKKRKAGKFRKF